MKQLSTIAFILFFIANSLIAQNQEASTSINKGEKPVRFGIHLDAKKTFQQLSYTERTEALSSYSFSIGGDIYYKLSNHFTLKSGLNLHRISLRQKDSAYNFSCGVIPNNFDSYLIQNNVPFYLGIPLEAKIKLIGQENHLYLKTGLEVLFNVASTSKRIITVCGTEPMEIDTNFPIEFSNPLFRLKSGIGYETSFIKESKLFFEPQFEYSFKHVSEQHATNSNEINKIKIFDIGIMLGVIF